jgi:hypothetical protein
MMNLLLRDSNSLEQGPPAAMLFLQPHHWNFLNSDVHERPQGIERPALKTTREKNASIDHKSACLTGCYMISFIK